MSTVVKSRKGDFNGNIKTPSSRPHLGEASKLCGLGSSQERYLFAS